MTSKTQKGSALIFALIFLLVLSVMAASMMFLSQSETWSGMNYKMMTQTRYGAEAGIHAAANYLMYSYTPPASMAGFNTGVYPVTTTAGNNVILSS
ncbi:MAG TPA: pilus assembly PilX N-terminal domain-containing protein, partial [Candidatus Acidoferrum sp.]|nr:pilus assembly PilX N-terminal domain-containing protein [Candidatus Acidoferrum sp.]